MSKTADFIGQAAADSTNALNPLLGGINRQELLGSVAMMLRLYEHLAHGQRQVCRQDGERDV